MKRAIVVIWLAVSCVGCSQSYCPPPDGSLVASARQLLKAGDAAAARGDWKEACSRYDQARLAAPQSHLPLYCLARACEATGGREAVAIAYYRACIVAMPAGYTNDAQLIGKRIDRLDGRIVRDSNRMASKARKMLETMDKRLWWSKNADRDETITLLTFSKLPDMPAIKPNPSRGQPSMLASLELKSWLKLADEFGQNHHVSAPAAAIQDSGSSVEVSIRAVALCASQRIEALSKLRQNEQYWQQHWDALFP